MWILITIVALLAILFGISATLTRRMRQRISEFVGSNGGSVRRIKPTLQRRAEFFVVYQSRVGDLRRSVARVRAGSVSVIEDRPYHHCLRRPPRLPPGSAPKISLDDLQWLGELQNLPGYKDYVQPVRQLRAGPHELRISEDENRFAALFRCVEMQSIAETDDASATLDVVVDGQPTNMSWWIDGQSPHRVLTVHAAPA